MKWQNLIRKKCPKCGGDLASRKDKTVLYECGDCDFLITERKLFEILMDDTHVLRQHLGPQELAIINQAIEKETQV